MAKCTHREYSGSQRQQKDISMLCAELSTLLECSCSKGGTFDANNLKQIDDAINFFFSFCNETREHDSTPWMAMCILRLFHSNSYGNIWIDTLPPGTTWTTDRPSCLHHLVVTILRTAIKFDKQYYYSFKVDNLASEFCSDYLRSLETNVLEAIEWRIFFSTPIDFLAEHKFDFNVTDHEFNVIKLMLIYCAKSDALCRSCRSGSLVIACLSFLRKTGNPLFDGLEIILTMASVAHPGFQKSVSLPEIDRGLQLLQADPQTKRFVVPERERMDHARSPSTVQTKRSKIRPKRPRLEPAPTDENANFSDSKCATPSEHPIVRRRIIQPDSSS